MSGLPKAKLMWIDLTASTKQAELPSRIVALFDVVQPHFGSSVELEIRRQEPDVLLFDFDYPDRSSLKLLETTKQKFPGIAILMMTVQHSESLAVWAFRSRVWDYLVKPLSETDLVRVTDALSNLLEKMKFRSKARAMHSKSSPMPAENRVSPTKTTPAELMPALAYIETHFTENVTSSMVAAACRLDTFRFSRAFKNAFGITFKEYLLRTRVREACRLLEAPGMSVTDVAYLAGFNDPSYFSKVFKKYTDVCPSEYAASEERQEIASDARFSLTLKEK